jgi:hypothetical protein
MNKNTIGCMRFFSAFCTFFILTIFPARIQAQLPEPRFRIQDMQGKELYTDMIQLYPDTLVCGSGSSRKGFYKIPIRNIAYINNVLPDSSEFKRQPYPTEFQALRRMRGAQLGAFWSAIAISGLVVAFPEVAVPVAIGGGLVSAGLYLHSFSGIARLERYRRIPAVEGF